MCSLEKATDKGSMPVPNDAAPSKTAITKTEAKPDMTSDRTGRGRVPVIQRSESFPGDKLKLKSSASGCRGCVHVVPACDSVSWRVCCKPSTTPAARPRPSETMHVINATRVRDVQALSSTRPCLRRPSASAHPACLTAAFISSTPFQQLSLASHAYVYSKRRLGNTATSARLTNISRQV